MMQQRQMCSLCRMQNCWKYLFSVPHILKCSKFSVLSWILESNNWSWSPSLWCCNWHRCWTAWHGRVDRQFVGKRIARSEKKVDNNWNMAILAWMEWKLGLNKKKNLFGFGGFFKGNFYNLLKSAQVLLPGPDCIVQGGWTIFIINPKFQTICTFQPTYLALKRKTDSDWIMLLVRTWKGQLKRKRKEKNSFKLLNVALFPFPLCIPFRNSQWACDLKTHTLPLGCKLIYGIHPDWPSNGIKGNFPFHYPLSWLLKR